MAEIDVGGVRVGDGVWHRGYGQVLEVLEDKGGTCITVAEVGVATRHGWVPRAAHPFSMLRVTWCAVVELGLAQPVYGPAAAGLLAARRGEAGDAPATPAGGGAAGGEAGRGAPTPAECPRPPAEAGLLWRLPTE